MFKNILVILIFFLISCSDSPTSVKDIEKPTVLIVSPADNSEFNEGTVLTIKADAVDNLGIARVDFYVDGEVVGTDDVEPFQLVWNSEGKAGEHTIIAKAYDKAENVAQSNLVNLYIKNASIPTASFTVTPSTGNMFTVFQFDASGSSDKEDDASSLIVRWDWENDGHWDTESSLEKTISHQYKRAGTYIVKLKVMDNDGLIGFDSTQITVSTGENGDTATITDIDGNIYNVVKIGEQWWMAENLKVTRFQNGDPILRVDSNTQWPLITSPAYCVYDNDDFNKQEMGLLYNWYAVTDSRNIAPEGWHVPTDQDFLDLENYLIANGYNWDGSLTGNKIAKSLASSRGWDASADTGCVGNDLATNNASGFSGLPTGKRHFQNGSYSYLYMGAIWWTSTECEETDCILTRTLFYMNEDFGHASSEKNSGLSVRLVLD